MKRDKLHVMQTNSSFIPIEGMVTTEGDFACHDTFNPNTTATPVFTVTHVPSGMAVKTHIDNLYFANLLLLRCSKATAKWDGNGDMPRDFRKEIKSVRYAIEQELEG